MNEFVQVFPENWQKNYENKGFITPSLIQPSLQQVQVKHWLIFGRYY